MKNPIEGKLGKFNLHQELGTLALEDVNAYVLNLPNVLLKQKRLRYQLRALLGQNTRVDHASAF